MNKKPALAAVGFMESDFVRYLIQDEKGRFWTGKGFTKDQRKALAYADENVIARDMRRILKRRCKGLIRYRFVAPVHDRRICRGSNRPGGDGLVLVPKRLRLDGRARQR